MMHRRCSVSVKEAPSHFIDSIETSNIMNACQRFAVANNTKQFDIVMNMMEQPLPSWGG